MVVVSIDTVGTQRFVRGFTRYGEAMGDMSEIFETLYDDFTEMEKRIFSSQGDPEKFQALSPRYREWKERHYPGRKIMQLFGRLKASLTGNKGADSVREIRRQKAVFGTVVPYAHRHQEGTMGMPQRKVVQLTEVRKRRWAQKIHKWAYEKAQELI